MHECTVCNKKFQSQGALIQHLNDKKDEKHRLHNKKDESQSENCLNGKSPAPKRLRPRQRRPCTPVVMGEIHKPKNKPNLTVDEKTKLNELTELMEKRTTRIMLKELSSLDSEKLLRTISSMDDIEIKRLEGQVKLDASDIKSRISMVRLLNSKEVDEEAYKQVLNLNYSEFNRKVKKKKLEFIRHLGFGADGKFEVVYSCQSSCSEHDEYAKYSSREENGKMILNNLKSILHVINKVRAEKRAEIKLKIEQMKKDAWEEVAKSAKEFKDKNPNICRVNIPERPQPSKKKDSHLGRSLKSKNKLLDMATG